MAELAPPARGLAPPRRVPLEPLRRRTRARLDAPPARPAVRLLTFSALGLYGALRWASLVAPAASGRMLVLLALAVVTGGVLGRLAQQGGRSRLLAAVAVLVPLLATFPISGVPLTLVVHLHIAAIAAGIDQGLTALPRVLVPYAGLNGWARTVIVLGGGLLLLDAGVLLAFVPQALGDARRAAAALPLIALAVVPSALETPHVAYLQGLLLFALVAAFVWGERLGSREVRSAVAVAAVAGLAGVLLAPGLDTHRPLLNYQAIANSFSPSGVESFDWFQGYGPYDWPTSGKQVLRIQAAHPGFWKTENLDDFDGSAWTEATQSLTSIGTTPPLPPSPSAAATATWTQTLHVTVGTMDTSDVVASGVAQRPQDVPGGVTPGPSPGTWLANQQLGPGDAYSVKVYTPTPSAPELAAAGDAYSSSLAYYLEMFVPVLGANSVPGTVVFPAFGSPASPASTSYISSKLGASPYAQAYRLAQRLAKGATTPYAFVERVYRYLQPPRYSYNTDAPRSAYPIETFLFKDKYGYCQHFAGAMALLLRMGGIPARVAVGFTPGTYSSSTGEWVVDDFAAHAWVEVWFPTYGWVAFNPTPSSTPTPKLGASPGASKLRARGLPGKLRATSSPASALRRHTGSSSPLALIVVIVLLLALGGAGLALWRRGRAREPPSGDEMLAELERALRRTSFTLTPATTLAELERRFRRSP